MDNSRFKFRLWDKTEKIMHFIDFVIAPTGYIAKLNELYDIEYDNEIDQEKEIKSENKFMIDNTDLDFEKDKILMQCTGLKDKNGMLIYEGDIIKSDFNFLTNTINPMLFNIGSIIYSDFSAGYVIASDNKDFSPYKNAVFGKVEAANCEVIGNIYENPELLEIE